MTAHSENNERHDDATQKDSSSSGASAPIDLDQLAEIADGDPEFEKILIASFLESVGDSLKTISEHVNESDWEQSRRDAHKIKGACATLGAEKLRQLAMDLEQNCTDPSGEPARKLTQELRGEFDKVRDYLQKRLEGIA